MITIITIIALITIKRRSSYIVIFVILHFKNFFLTSLNVLMDENTGVCEQVIPEAEAPANLAGLRLKRLQTTCDVVHTFPLHYLYNLGLNIHKKTPIA